MDDECTWILFCCGNVVSGSEDVNVHSSSAETPLLADVLGTVVDGARSRRSDDGAAGCVVAFFGCWNGEEARGLGDISAANGSTCEGVAAACTCLCC